MCQVPTQPKQHQALPVPFSSTPWKVVFQYLWAVQEELQNSSLLVQRGQHLLLHAHVHPQHHHQPRHQGHQLHFQSPLPGRVRRGPWRRRRRGGPPRRASAAARWWRSSRRRRHPRRRPRTWR
uniref:Uncharacterized protein n=1 Tax=Arundo donax TaxID=35708 RepID=A0A0A9EZK0_ARUDO